ncbi:MAG: LPS-assembly protein LptD [Acidobacteria bacterium]|nr:LPS-assembly protein LptD [Acidobacteriota bacterium]
MTSRTLLIITAAMVCHLLLTPPLVTSQLLAAQTQAGAASSVPNTPSFVPEEEDVTWKADSQEKDGMVFKLHGHAEIHYGLYVLYADEVTYNSETRDATVEGHVVLDGGLNDEHVEASRGAYNFRTQVGRFEHVLGTVGIRNTRGRSTLTSANPFVFTGKVVEKTGPDHYRVFDGTITTCELPHPKWEFNARKTVVDVGGNATIYNSTFRIRGVPILYLPFATHPVQREVRKTGFLIPNFGRSSRKGTILGESVYWAINRTMDLTAGAEYYSMRGWAPQGEFRARPSEGTYIDLNYFAVVDKGFGNPRVDQGGANVRLDAETTFGHNFRGVMNIDYLTSYVFRLAFNEVFTLAINSEVKSQAFLSNTTRGFSFNASTQRYQNFESTNNGDVITILHAPSFEVSSVDRRLGRSPFYWSMDAAVEGLSRSEPSFRTADLLGRFDLSPTLSAPLLFRGWSFRPSITLRDTIYTQRLMPSNGIGVAVSDPINRRSAQGDFEIRPPSLEKVFGREFLGRKWKHVVEPRAAYHYVTGVNNFSNVLRFDARDILSNTNEVEYALVNRLYAKRTSNEAEDCDSRTMPGLILGGAPTQSRIPWERTDPSQTPCETGPQVREIVRWELGQKYFLDPTFGGALVPGERNVFTTTADLTGIAFLTDARRLSPLISRLRISTSERTDAEWDLDYDFRGGRINTSTALVNYHFGQFTVGGGDAFLQAPTGTNTISPTPVPQRFNQFRLLFGYGSLNKRGFSGAANVGFDANLAFLQYASVQTTYNWDCCGVNLEYRRFSLGSVRNENQFRFTFSLANIGGFGNLRRQERLF